MQNRTAQHNYRLRQQNLVSSLQAERERLRRENVELKRALEQIERFTVGWQLSRDAENHAAADNFSTVPFMDDMRSIDVVVEGLEDGGVEVFDVDFLTGMYGPSDI